MTSENGLTMDRTKPVGEVFTAALGYLDGKKTICVVVGRCPGETTFAWFAPQSARSLATHLNAMADELDLPKQEWRVTDTADGKMVAALGDEPAKRGKK